MIFVAKESSDIRSGLYNLNHTYGYNCAALKSSLNFDLVSLTVIGI